MDKNQLKENVETAIQGLTTNDRFLIKNGLHEITIAHKLAEYLELGFKDWDVDIEYNKKIDVDLQGNTSKEILNRFSNAGESGHKQQRGLRIDIIIHHRGKNGNDDNLLAIELKKVGNPSRRNKDEDALKQLTDQNGSYRYQFGLFIDMNKEAHIDEKWFVNGSRQDI